MNASQAKTGCKYISRTGIPVTVIGNKNGKVSLKLAATGSVIRVNSDYELKPIDDNNSSHEPKSRSKTSREANPGIHKTISLSSIIDPMLLAGRYTVKEIAAEVAGQAGETTFGKDIEANVRARMVSYKRRGWRVVKNGKRVQIAES